MTDHDFHHKTAIVTGAGMGIGFEIARQLALRGASVVLNDVDEGRATAATDHIRKEGGHCLPVVGNVADVEVNQQLVAAAVDQFGRLDIVVANAGITSFGDFFTYSPEAFDQLLGVNLRGSFFLAQAAARRMRDQGEGGRIVFMSSVTGLQAHPDLAAYGMTKAALMMLARTLTVELGPHGITVNAIAPGATLTERTSQELPNYAETYGKLAPTGRVCTPTDIANAALFLCSPQAAQINGQTLVVDGGWTTTSPTPER